MDPYRRAHRIKLIVISVAGLCSLVTVGVLTHKWTYPQVVVEEQFSLVEAKPESVSVPEPQPEPKVEPKVEPEPTPVVEVKPPPAPPKPQVPVQPLFGFEYSSYVPKSLTLSFPDYALVEMKTAEPVTAPLLTQSLGFVVLTNAEGEDASKVSDWVIEGFHHILLFEDRWATLAFMKALQVDPQCLMAHCGMVLTRGLGSNALLPRVAESISWLEQAVALPDLPEKDKAFVDAVLAYQKAEPEVANKFKEISNTWRADLWTRIFSIMLAHKGFEADGSFKTPSVVTATADILETNAENPAANFVRMLLEEARPQPSDEAFVAAEKAAVLLPAYPMAQHALGHYQFKKGLYDESAKTFAKAALLYDGVKNPIDVSNANDEGWLRAKEYEVISLFCAGKQDDAFKLARTLAALPVDTEHKEGRGTMHQVWEVKTLPARLLMGYDSASMMKLGSSTFKDEAKLTLKADALTPDQLYRRALSEYFDTRALIANKASTEQQLKAYEEFGAWWTRFKESQAQAYKDSVAGFWARAYQLLGCLDYELKARLYPDTRSVWRQNAVEAQTGTSMFMPPVIPFPLEWVEAKALLDEKKNDEAKALLQQGLVRFPNHSNALQALAVSEGKPENSVPVQVVSASQSGLSSGSSPSSPTKASTSSSRKAPTKASSSSKKKPTSRSSSKRRSSSSRR